MMIFPPNSISQVDKNRFFFFLPIIEGMPSYFLVPRHSVTPNLVVICSFIWVGVFLLKKISGFWKLIETWRGFKRTNNWVKGASFWFSCLEKRKQSLEKTSVRRRAPLHTFTPWISPFLSKFCRREVSPSIHCKER